MSCLGKKFLLSTVFILFIYLFVYQSYLFYLFIYLFIYFCTEECEHKF